MTSAVATPATGQPRRRSAPLKERLTPWFFAAPGLALLFVFLVLPFVLALVLSFTDQRLVTNEELGTDFVALRNYVRLFEDDSFWAALRNNFYFVAVVTPLQSALALLLAGLAACGDEATRAALTRAQATLASGRIRPRMAAALAPKVQSARAHSAATAALGLSCRV